MPAHATARRVLWVGLVLAVTIQLVGLYDPSPSGAGLSVSDKLVHACLFGVPTLLGGLLGLRVWWPALLAVHAPVSELVQARLLPTRSGDPLDVVADLVGIGVALVLVMVLRRRRHPVR